VHPVARLSGVEWEHTALIEDQVAGTSQRLVKWPGKQPASRISFRRNRGNGLQQLLKKDLQTTKNIVTGKCKLRHCNVIIVDSMDGTLLFREFHIADIVRVFYHHYYHHYHLQQTDESLYSIIPA